MKKSAIKKNLALVLATLTLGGSLNSITYAVGDGIEQFQKQQDFVGEITNYLESIEKRIEEINITKQGLEQQYDELTNQENGYSDLEGWKGLKAESINREKHEIISNDLSYWEEKKQELGEYLKQAIALNEKKTAKKPKREVGQKERILKLQRKIESGREELLRFIDQQTKSITDEKGKIREFFSKEETRNADYNKIEHYDEMLDVASFGYSCMGQFLCKIVSSKDSWCTVEKLCKTVSKSIPSSQQSTKIKCIEMIGSLREVDFLEKIRALIDGLVEIKHRFYYSENDLSDEVEEALRCATECYRIFKNDFSMFDINTLDPVYVCEKIQQLVSNIIGIKSSLCEICVESRNILGIV